MGKKRDLTAVFASFISGVKVGEQRMIRHSVMEGCNVSSATYCKWMRGAAVPRVEHRITINAVAASYGYAEVYYIEGSSC